jgi:hypothetical protein
VAEDGRPGSDWVNRGSRVLLPTPVPYAPIHCVLFVAVPVLMMVAPTDEMALANVEVTRHTCELLAGPNRWGNIEGGHFGLLYHPGARFDRAAGI